MELKILVADTGSKQLFTHLFNSNCDNARNEISKFKVLWQHNREPHLVVFCLLCFAGVEVEGCQDQEQTSL